VPPTIRDILQCLAERDLYRPVWQEAIEIEVLRNGARLLVKRSGFDPGDVAVTIQRTVGFMHIAFPAARLDPSTWEPLVSKMTNNLKDRHVLAAAVGAQATHLVTSNLRDFAETSVPDDIELIDPQSFCSESLRPMRTRRIRGGHCDGRSPTDPRQPSSPKDSQTVDSLLDSAWRSPRDYECGPGATVDSASTTLIAPYSWRPMSRGRSITRDRSQLTTQRSTRAVGRCIYAFWPAFTSPAATGQFSAPHA
jgi:hypothetical protein